VETGRQITNTTISTNSYADW